eukprot:COSAG01_NODE_10257_length_2208_cov_2.192034_1_plen_213_part_00
MDGGGAAALRKALIHLAAQEKQRLHRGAPPVRTEWVFRRSSAAAATATTPLSDGGGGGGGLPAALRTDSQVSFSSTLTNVRTFDLSPTEETAKQRHWQAVKLGSEQQQGSGSPQRPWSAAAAAAADTVATAERTAAHTRVLASAKVAQAAREEAAAAAEEAAAMRAKCGGPPALPVTAAGTSPPPPPPPPSICLCPGRGLRRACAPRCAVCV